MTPENFWHGWLKVTVIMIIAVGAIMLIGAPFLTSEFLDYKINKLFLMGEFPGDPTHIIKKWIIGIAGAIMIGWGCTMFYIIIQPFKRYEKWAWRALFYPMIIWYLVDSTISSYYGAGINVLINTVLFLQIMAPLLNLRSQFFPKINVV